MRQVLPVVPAKHNPHYLIFKSCKSLGDWNRNFTYFCVLFEVYCSTMQGCSFHLLKQERPWMLANLKIICQFHAHSVRQNSVEIFWAEIYRGRLYFRAEIYRWRLYFRAEIYRGRLLTLITGSSSRLLRIRFSADLIMYWFPVYHFRCMKFKSLVIWIWYQNIAISTIVGTSSHIT